MIHDSDQDNKIPSSGLRAGAIGWQHRAWLDGFYPEDLPEDWQLGYYANEFSTVLVPTEIYQSSEPAGLAEHWLDDVSDSFVFYLQWPESALARDRASVLAELLGTRCGGLISQQPVSLNAGADVYSFEHRDNAHRIWTPEQDGGAGVGLVTLGGTEIRTWRHWLERFQHSSGGHLKALFVSDADVNMAGLQQLKTLVELMGL